MFSSKISFFTDSNLIACFPLPAFFPGKSIIPYQLCLLLWLYITLLQLCFLTNNCLFQCRWYFNFDGIYPEGIHLMDVSPGSAGILPCALNVMLQECTNKVLDKSYLPGTVWSRKDLLQWTGILMKRKMYIKKKKLKKDNMNHKICSLLCNCGHAEEFPFSKHPVQYLGFHRVPEWNTNFSFPGPSPAQAL